MIFKTYVLLVSIFLIYLCNAEKWAVQFKESRTEIMMEQTVAIAFNITGPEIEKPPLIYKSTNDQVLQVFQPIIEQKSPGTWDGKINVTSIFIGSSNVSISILNTSASGFIQVVVKRPERLIDKIFTASVAGLCAILYINFGCAMDWNVCHETMKKPIGPAIGVICQFLFMPVASYLIGYILFPDNAEMRLGIFFTGISPSGGASNIWTMLLDGNLNLSVTMTTLGTFLAFGMIPFWLFTLGRHIFKQAQMTVPYDRISMFAVGLLIPLAVGYLIQKKCPRLSRIMVRIMKPFAVVLILFIVVFAIVTNAYLFQLFSWRIIVAGISLPWIGYVFGYIAARMFRQSTPDVRAISIETGIQNTGIAIFLVRFGLIQPTADLTTVTPVSVAVMTPLPLIVIYIMKLWFDRKKKRKSSIEQSENKDQSTITQTNSYTTLDQ